MPTTILAKAASKLRRSPRSSSSSVRLSSASQGIKNQRLNLTLRVWDQVLTILRAAFSRTTRKTEVSTLDSLPTSKDLQIFPRTQLLDPDSTKHRLSPKRFRHVQHQSQEFSERPRKDSSKKQRKILFLALDSTTTSRSKPRRAEEGLLSKEFESQSRW